MTPRPRGPVWLTPFRAVCRTLLGLYPVGFRNACGWEILQTTEDRLLQTRATRGRMAALRFAITELGNMMVAAVEMRRPAIKATYRASTLEAIRTDVVHAVRGIRRAPGPAGIVILLIALAVGLNTSVYSVVEGLLLEPLPFTNSDKLVHVWADRSWQNESRGLLADVQLKTLREETESFEGLSALWMVSGRILGGDRPVHTDVGRVSSNFFDLLDVEPFLGRTFEKGEDQPGAPWVAMLDYDYWVQEFDADPNILGRRVVVGWPEMEIVGVLPPDFHFRVPPELGAHRDPDVWIPWWHSDREDGRAAGGILAVVGRTAEGTTLAEARKDLARLARVEDQVYYDARGFEYRIERLQRSWMAEVRPALLILTGAVAFVLLIAIANAATLLLARNQGRRRELGVHRALGASRFRVARLLITESLMLTLAGGALGVALAEWGTRGLLALAPAGLPRLDAVDVDGSVLGFALLISVGSGLVAVMASLARSRRIDPDDALQGSRGRMAESTRTRRAQRTFVVAQVAFSAVLLFEAGLFIRTFTHIQSTDLGFQDEGRITFNTYLMEEYDTHESHVTFYRDLRQRIGAIPGVRGVSGTSALPLSGNAPRIPASTFARERDVNPDGFFLTEGFSVLFADELDALQGDGWTLTDVTAAQPGYFTTAGIPRLAGREFGPEDRIGASLRVIIDRNLAERFWTVTSAVGKKLWIAGAWREVVGVTQHIQLTDLREPVRAQVYLPFDQVQSGRVSMVVHTDGDPSRFVPRIREAVANLDPLVPIADVRTMESIVRDVTARDRFSTLLMSVFAGAAVLMVALGVYGVLSFSVRERIREMALRVTVGMGRARLAGMILAEGVMPTVVGLTIGIGAAIVVGKASQPVLYGVAPYDLVTLAGVSIVIVLVSLMASWLPALRALSINPADTLQAD